MKKLFTILTLTTLIVGGIGGCRATDTTPEVADINRLLKEGWDYYRSNEFDSALAKFDTAVTLVDPSNLEAHLGRGLSLMRKGLYPDAHREFALIYSPYVQENIRIETLYVDPSMEWDMSSGSPPPSAVIRVDPNGSLVSGGTKILAAWRLDTLFAANGISLEDAQNIYLPVDLKDIKVNGNSVDPETYTTALTPTAVPLSVTGSVSYVDTSGPVIFLVGDVGSDEPLLYNWITDATQDTVVLNLVTLKVSKSGLGDESDIVWMALAADAHTYYIEDSDKRKAAYLAFAAYMLFPLRGDVSGKNYSGIRGLTESDSTVLKGLAGVASLGYFKSGWVGNAVSVIRFFGDPTFPNPNWNYLPDNSTQMTYTVGYTKDDNVIWEVYQRANQVFFGR